MYDIELKFTDGSNCRCKILGGFFAGKIEYALLLGEDKSVYVYRLTRTKGKHKLTEITDPEEFEQVIKAVKAMCKSREKALRSIK